MAAKSNKNKKTNSGAMTLEDAIAKSRTQVAENADLVEKTEVQEQEQNAQADELRSKPFLPKGIDTSGLEENENDENLKVKPEALVPPKVNPYSDQVMDEEAEAATDGRSQSALTAGQILRSHRIKRKMSINEVANEIRARPSTVAEIENDSLCMHTAKDFAESFIARYAKLFGLDPNDLIARYRRTLAQNVKTIPDTKPKKKLDIQLARSWFMVVLVILVATIGYFVFSAQEASKKEEQQSGVTIVQNEPQNTTQSAVEMFGSNAQNQASVVIEEPGSGNGPEVRVVDENTARATAQQMAMQQNADGTMNVPQAAAAKAKESLNLPPNAQPNQGAANITVNNNITVGAPANVTVGSEKKTMISNAQAEAEAQAKAKAEAEAKAKAEAEAKAEKAPQLAASLKDISSSVRVINRDGLASLNRAEIAVTKPVSLKVVDSSGKVLASGSYDKGDSIKVTGIPPINVQMSSTDAVKISYMGGHISMPAGKQVKFDLPMR